MKHTCFQKRRAIFLVELALTMAIGAVLLGVTLALLAAVLRADPVASKGGLTPTELDRFTDRLRRDLHRADGIETPQPNELKLKMGVGDVFYELRDRLCVRREQMKPGEERTTPYAIDATSWRVDGVAEPGHIVTVWITLQNDSSAETLLTIPVTAQLKKYNTNSAPQE